VQYAREEPDERRGLYRVKCAGGAVQEMAAALVEKDGGMAAESALRLLAGWVALSADA
jgi:hypothetical protein